MNGRPKTGDKWNFILLATSADLCSLFSKVCRSPVLLKRGEHAVKQTNNNKKKKKRFRQLLLLKACCLLHLKQK
jgi:hypothetical protein